MSVACLLVRICAQVTGNLRPDVPADRDSAGDSGIDPATVAESDPPSDAFTTVATRRSSWQLLRGREFRLYFTGGFASNLGAWLQNTVQVILAYQLTGSIFTVGLIVALQFAGIPLLSPFAAAIAGWLGLEPRKFLIRIQIASAVIAGGMAAMYAAGDLTVFVLAAGALLLGAAYSLALPVQVTMVPALVPPQDAEAAVQMNSVSYNAGRALGPALSVLIIATTGPVLVFLLNALSFALFAVALHRLKPVSAAVGHDIRGVVYSRPSERVRVTDGIRIALTNPRILLLLAIVATVTLADDPVQVLSPALTASMHAGKDWTGYFIAALGWGAVAASVFPKPPWDRDIRRASRRAAAWLLVLAGSVLVFAAGLAPWVSLVAAFAAGVAALATGAAAQTALIVRDSRGAPGVAALWAIAWAGTKPFASFLDGWLAGGWGVHLAAAILVIPALALSSGEFLIPDKAKDVIKNWAADARLVRLLKADTRRL